MAMTQGEKGDAPGFTPGQLDGKAPIDSEISQSEEVGVVKDGMRVHPQPTGDPLDPLNWSAFKKHLILAIVMYL